MFGKKKNNRIIGIHKPRFVIMHYGADAFGWELRAVNGRIIAESNTCFSNRRDALRSITSLRQILSTKNAIMVVCDDEERIWTV